MAEVETNTEESSEIFFGLVGAVGTDLELVSAEIQIVLREFEYAIEEIRLSALLRELNWDQELDDAHLDRHISTYMDAGNRLRRDWRRGDALALLAINQIAEIRAKENGDDADPKPLKRTAYVFNSLKHPDEVSLLRDVFGSRFYVVSAYAPQDVRKEALSKAFSKEYGSENEGDWACSPDGLIARDEEEVEPKGLPEEERGMGQNVRDTFHRADFFLEARDKESLKQDSRRMIEIVFGHPFRTPTLDEFALFEAEGAARRSAEPGRQVGASIAGDSGTVIALGANEVPRASGGTYWEERLAKGGEKDEDGREFSFAEGVETNAKMRHEIAEEIVGELSREGWLKKAGEEKPNEVMAAIEKTRLGNIIEFGRAAHAEMDALMDAARRGVSVQDGILYTTTFPCHNCARHIVLAGISKVVYVAPYAKSLAGELHSDAIEIAKSQPSEGKVHFEPFVGVAPRRYLDFFEAGQRKSPADGSLQEFVPSDAIPRISDSEPNDLRLGVERYMQREEEALDLMGEIWEGTGLAPGDRKE